MILTFSTMMATSSCSSPDRANPFLEAEYGTRFEIPPFDSIAYEDYMPAIREGIAQRKTEIEAIVNNSDEPDFNNTILALEQSGKLLNRVMAVFNALNETDSSPEMEAIDAEATPLTIQAQDEIMMNPRLFERVKSVYDRREQLGLTGPQLRAVEKCYRDFVRSGALLNDADKAELSKLNTQLADLYIQFNRNLLSATNAFGYTVSDSARLAGLPAASISQAADEAAARGLDNGNWVFTLHAPSRLPLLQYARDRELRKAVYEGYINLASEGEFDNRPVIAEIQKVRTAKARLLGYNNFAEYMTANVMAKNPANAEKLLGDIWQPAVKRVHEEVAEMQALADKMGDSITIEPHDYYYYAELVRRNKYDMDEDQVRAYFSIDNVRNGIFEMAKRLYGISFVELPDAPKYHPEVNVYEVLDADSNHVAVFMTDYFPRASKRQGAWMSEMRSAFVDPDGTSQRPIVYNVGNFSRPSADGTPALLTLDEVETMFHEFGHGLHGMLTRAALRSQAGTEVDRDFVELPSQIHEHWALEPELLRDYAFHYQTGEPIPADLVEKLQASSKHNMGFVTTGLAGAALLDLQWGQLNVDDNFSADDVTAFEQSVAGKLGLPKEVQFRYRSPYFRHIFGSDGYASGYYTYLWAEVLDTDGFELFAEKGIFDPATADSFRRNILEAGGSEDPMTLFVRFRGHEPSVDALLRHRGLIADKTIANHGGR